MTIVLVSMIVAITTADLMISIALKISNVVSIMLPSSISAIACAVSSLLPSDAVVGITADFMES